MIKRLPLILALSLGTLGIGLVWRELARSREPLYDGKPLSTWARELSSNRSDIKDAAAGRIRVMGTNAVPLLVHLANYPPPSRYQQFKRQLLSWLHQRSSSSWFATARYPLRERVESLFPPLEANDIPVLIDLLETDQAGVVLAQLRQLGMKAVPALTQPIPHLSLMTRLEISKMLLILARDPGNDRTLLLPFFVCGTTDEVALLSYVSAVALVSLQTNYDLAISALLRVQTNKEARLRAAAASVIKSIPAEATNKARQ